MAERGNIVSFAFFSSGGQLCEVYLSKKVILFKFSNYAKEQRDHIALPKDITPTVDVSMQLAQHVFACERENRCLMPVHH